MRPMIVKTSAVNDVQILPYDLVEDEILSRLPVKLLLQFRCVCKSWNSLISDPRFVKKHLSMSTMRRLYFVRVVKGSRMIASCSLQCIFNPSCRSRKKTKKKPLFSINVRQLEYLEYPLYHFDYPHLEMIGSCNGILCLARKNIDVDKYFDIVLWNPSLKKVKELPQPQLCYPNISHILFGFGYDFVTDKYKVVAVLYYRVHDSNGDLLNKAIVMIHTLGTNFWKNIQESPFNSMIGGSYGKIVSGTINWLASKCWQKYSVWSPSKCWLESTCFIVSLDFGTESYQKFMLPDYGEVDEDLLKLCVLRDCLCLISGYDFWMMKEYGNTESWIKLFSVPYMGEPSISKFLSDVVYMFEDGQVLFESSEDGWGKTIVHDPKISTIKYIKFQDKSVHHIYDRDPIVCIESLVSPCF